ncbi:mercuric reductase [Phycicoccus sp. Soil802]|nr:mercuric reductase [Phycicoccus sp. Soil802]
MSAAIHASLLGATAVVIERGTLGGTCVNVGCIPSKTLLAAAAARHVAATNPFRGAPTSAGPVDLAALVSQKDELLGRLRQAKYADVAAAYDFPVIHGSASFDGPNTLLVDGQPLTANAFIVATGAEGAVPDLPGLVGTDYLTSTTAMALDALPESLVVIGGGYVGLEQAQLFAHLGVPVTIVGRLAPRAEPELASVLRRVFLDDGVTVVNDRATAVGHEGQMVTVTTRRGRMVTGQRLLVATGRTPRTDGLALEKAGVNTDDRGFVVTDSQQRSSNPKVYAAGDVTGAPQFVYVAAATGKVAAHNALGRDEQVDYTGLPSVTFTRPQLASAGLTEQQALDQGIDCSCRVLDLADVPRALVNHDTRGVVKVVADAQTSRVVGVHALADSAGEMMLAATYAIKAGFTTDQLADTWVPYLTMAESIRLTAWLFRNQLPTSCCA